MAIPRTYATAGAFRRALEERLKSMSQTERWRLKLQKVFALAGGFQETPVPHRFRHTFASDMLRAGVSLPALMQLMGHADIQTTLLYVQVTPQDVYLEYARAVAQHIRPLPVTVS